MTFVMLLHTIWEIDKMPVKSKVILNQTLRDTSIVINDLVTIAIEIIEAINEQPPYKIEFDCFMVGKIAFNAYFEGSTVRYAFNDELFVDIEERIKYINSSKVEKVVDVINEASEMLEDAELSKPLRSDQMNMLKRLHFVLGGYVKDTP